VRRLIALLVVASSLAGCAGAPFQESARSYAAPKQPSPSSLPVSIPEEAAPEEARLPLSEADAPEEMPLPLRDARAQRQERYMQSIAAAGYAPFLDEAGDICFKNDNKTYFVIIDDNHNEITTVLYPNIVPITGEKERLPTAAAVSAVNRKAKVAKAYINASDWVSIGLELIVQNPQDFELLFERIMQLLLYAEREFINQMSAVVQASRP
jgi:hypothetical protein